MTEIGDVHRTQRHGEDRALLVTDRRDESEAAYFEDDDLVVAAGGDESIKTPRTPNRVRFDLTPEVLDQDNGSARGSFRDSLDDVEDDGDHNTHNRMPLLTDMEAPSVTVARSWGEGASGGDDADRLEEEMNRPKSGLKSAFMNMANSIIGAGIIGQPYAIRQAGLLAGILLLIGLTVLVDWTICLIVINSKLSGTSSFQGTVEYCFGQAGLIAISLAQWVFAFGGMVAFCVIVGDTIPHVLSAVWPGMADVPVIGLLTNRKIAIIVFVLAVSYPLTLYRDIAKVRTPSCQPSGGHQFANSRAACQGQYNGAHWYGGDCGDRSRSRRYGPVFSARPLRYADSHDKYWYIPGHRRHLFRWVVHK